MRRLLCATALFAVLATPGDAAAATTNLRIAYWPKAKTGAPSGSWRIRCNPSGGTIPNPARACTRLGSLHDPFGFPAGNLACDSSFGGVPGVATVDGVFRGRRIKLRLTRQGNCDVEVWNRVAFLIPSPRADLRIEARSSSTGPVQTWTLRCGPPGGTLPSKADACIRLAALTDPFGPVASGAMCTQIYGGPQIARVTGTFRGRSVAADFKRTDGCQIARWDRVAFLFPIRLGVP